MLKFNDENALKIRLFKFSFWIKFFINLGLKIEERTSDKQNRKTEKKPSP